jgi:hypothetical protein
VGETVFTAGVFRDTADFDPNPEVSNLTSAGANDFFIAAYSDLPPYDEAVTPIPTVNEWGMIIFSLLLVGVSLCFMRKGKRTL